ncbi:unnamed protein product [Clonostachys chloroleuca]|uniref:Kinesin light chain n=1 Tax=Clonostachys chloroleuca TaxID=1926264 RepID=A0AA35LT99_9HYPO|nr:unnamed protein product [Clonostachys chloroleuca]
MASPESKPLASDLSRRLTGNTDIIEVGTMSETEALSLLEKKIDVITDLGATTELVSALEYVPLAINQAAGYIQARAPRSSVQKYLADFRESERKRFILLGYDGGDLRRDGSTSNGVLTTWQISFEHIYSRRRSAAELMSLMRFFDRHNIPELLLKPAASTTIIDGDEESDSENSQGLLDDEFEDDVAMLKDFHLIKANENGIEFEMHGLVQLSTRKWLESQGLQEQFKEKYLTRLEASFPDGYHLENWKACRKLFPHVEKAIEYKPTGEKLEETWAALLTSGAWFALSQGRLVVAERMAHKTRRSYERLLGEEHKITLSAMFLFASVLLDKGQWTNAEELFVQMLETRKNTLEIDHPDTLAAMSHLALTYRIRGRWEDAEKLQVQVMEAQGRMKNFGADYSDTLTIMNNLALTYVSQGRWDDAAKLQLQVVEAGSMKLGIGHPGHLTELNNLALTYMGQNRWKDAEKLEVQVVDGRKITLGADHPDTLASINNLASIYANQGQCDDAKELFLDIIETHKAKLGFDHPNTLINMANLATTYRYQGRFKEAEQLHTQVLEAYKAKLGIDHPDTLTSMASLAYDWKRLGRHADALELMESCVRGRQQILGPEHPQTCSSVASIREWDADAEN